MRNEKIIMLLRFDPNFFLRGLFALREKEQNEYKRGIKEKNDFRDAK